MAKEKDVRKLATDIRQFKSNLERYLEDSQKELSRYRSWEHCYVQFQKAIISRKVDRDMLCLWLAWYLASWGMLSVGLRSGIAITSESKHSKDCSNAVLFVYGGGGLD